MTTYLAFHLGHDTNIAVAVNGKIRYRKSERQLGIKHHRAAEFKFVKTCLRDWGIEKVDYCAYTNPDTPNEFKCSKTELFCKGDLEEIPSFRVDHHYAHALSVWPVVDTQSLDYAVSVDGRGDWARHMMIIQSPAKNPTIVDAGYGWSLGREFYELGRILGFKGLEYDIAGKLMGLQAYSEEDIVNKFHLPPLKATSYKKTLESASHYDTLQGFHEYWWKFVENLFSRFNVNDRIAYSGGCAQNTVYNYRLKKLFPNLFIPPHCYDGGLSLGCLEFLRLKFGGPQFDTTGFPFWQDDPVPSHPNKQSIQKAAELLASGKIIGWMQGRGEVGPRALGNRSILMAANKAENKDIINQKVKKREPWRPYAGSILEGYASHYFDMPESQYMLYACQVLNNQIPAITHIDNTCRMQTVSDGPFCDLIEEYRKLTGLPIILNTSLNISRKPIISKKKDALILLNTSKLDAVFIGNELHSRSSKWFHL